MCLNPITIKNPSFGKSHYASQHGDLYRVPNALTPSTKEMKVPCGKCVECRATKYNAILQRGLVESMTSHTFLITLTFDNEHIPVLEFPDGKKIYYADYELVKSMFKRLRDTGIFGEREFRYLICSEFGDTKYRPHFHILLFVGKLTGDTLHEAYLLRTILFDTIRKIWAVNTGSRKNPVYEPLFTYKSWFNASLNRMESNYTVELVKPTFEDFSRVFDYANQLVTPDISDIKSQQYVLGYVQKPSQFDLEIEDYIKKYTDPVLKDKLKKLLCSRVVFSKGFGCGFNNGKKFYLPRISVRCSSNVIFYTDLVDNLPKSYEEFALLYPQLDIELQKFIKGNYYKKYRKLKWKQCLAYMTTDEYMYHCLFVKYFKKEFTNVYRSYFKRDKKVQDKISYYYSYAHDNTYYQMQTVRTVKPEKSLVYTYLRKGVEEGIAAKVPYIAFKMVGQQKFTALCKYYKERVCTFEDTLRMYDAIGVKNFEEWQELFQKQRNTRKSNLFVGNQVKYYNETKKITQTSCKLGKNYLSLHHSDKETIYNQLISNRKGFTPAQKHS